MITITHITTHLGGGVGKVLSDIAIFDKENRHRIILLEGPRNMKFVDICKNNQIEIIVSCNINKISSLIEDSDLVILHWWHNPVMAKFLSEFPQVSIRMILWVHVSGCTYPMLKIEFVKNFQKVLFATKYTFDNPYWNDSEKIFLNKRATLVYGLGKLDFGKKVQKNSSDRFVIGYVGTLNYSKLHPEFVNYCKAVVDKIPKAYFVVVGNLEEAKELLRDVNLSEIKDRFEFTGFVNNVDEQLERFDVFASPLNPYHFGATENAILEPMSKGIPVICLNQGAERYLILDRQTGMLVNDIQEYAESMEYLYNNPEERKRIGDNAIEYIQDEFSFKKNMDRFNLAVLDSLKIKKKTFEFKSIFGCKPYEWFLSCLGTNRKAFSDSIESEEPLKLSRKKNVLYEIENCIPILKEKHKSSIHHFADTFKEDKILQYWKSLIE